MRPEIQEIIDRKTAEHEKQAAEKRQKEKIELMDKFELYKKEYYVTEGNDYGWEQLDNKYPEVEWTAEGEPRRYKKVYFDLTDEEFDALKNAAELAAQDGEKEKTEASDLSEYQDKVAKVLMVLAFLSYAAFFVIGIIMGNNNIEKYLSSRSEFSFGAALVYWVAGFISGTLILGFAHIVEHLSKQTIMLNKLTEKIKHIILLSE